MNVRGSLDNEWPLVWTVYLLSRFFCYSKRELVCLFGFWGILESFATEFNESEN